MLRTSKHVLCLGRPEVRWLGGLRRHFVAM